MTQHLTVHTDQTGIATVTLNRPEVHNAFNAELIDALIRQFRALAADGAVRIAVLQGAGPSFCSGGDLNWLRSMKDYTYEQNRADSRELAALFETLDGFPKPLIGKIHGLALGGGSGLAAVCDYAIATADTQFGFTETRIGLIPAVISPYVMDKIGYSRARALFISGMRFSAAEALSMGLIHDTAPDADDLELRLAAVLKEFLRAGPEASMKAKALVRAVHRHEEDTAALIHHTVEQIARTRVSPEAQEGMAALLEKRPPHWVKPDA